VWLLRLHQLLCVLAGCWLGRWREERRCRQPEGQTGGMGLLQQARMGRDGAARS